jgi:hypothetical protein
MGGKQKAFEKSPPILINEINVSFVHWRVIKLLFRAKTPPPYRSEFIERYFVAVNVFDPRFGDRQAPNCRCCSAESIYKQQVDVGSL